MIHQLRLRVCLAALLTTAAANSNAQIEIIHPSMNHVHSSTCPAEDGSNVLFHDPVLYEPAGGPPNLILELRNGDTAFPGWIFHPGPALLGTLVIDIYKSRFSFAHHSGALIEARYKRAPTDPANLRWIQMAVTDAPPAGATSPYIDTFPNDDNLPFYWTAAQDLVNTNGANDFGIFDKRFLNYSSRLHNPTSMAFWRGYLMLVSWDGNSPGIVMIHDGIRWGWNGGCSEPNPPDAPISTNWGLVGLSLLLLVGAVLALRGRFEGGVLHP